MAKNSARRPFCVDEQEIMSTLGGTDQSWSVREKLCLASSVMRSGDQNWISVSRAIKPFADPGRQPEFFSQRNCARQYSALLENEDTPKRKRSSERGEVVETPGDLIVKKITMERMDELKAQIREDKLRFKQLKKEIDEIRSGTLDDRLQDMMNEIQIRKKTPEEEVVESPRSSTETAGKSSKSPLVPTPGKSSRRPPSRSISKTSRTSEGSDVDVIKHIEEPAGDSVFDFDESSSDVPTPSILDKHKLDLEKQESNDSIGGTDGSDVDVTVVSDVKSSSGSSTLSKLLTQKRQTAPSSSISPLEGPGSHLLSVSKTAAAKEAAKILLGPAGGRSSSEVCSRASGFQSVFDSFVQSDKDTEKKPAASKTESKETIEEDETDMKSSECKEKQDIPKLDLDISDLGKIDAAEDSDASNIPTEPSSPGPESETRGKKKSRGRPPNSSRRSGRSAKTRTQPDEDEGEDCSRRPSDSLGDDDGRDETRSETAESEETERPSAESDRDDASSIAAGSLQQSMFVDSLPGSPSSVTTEHEHDHAYKIWRKAIMLVWRTIAAHKYANIFLHPVTNDIAPGYCDIIHRRTDLTKVKKSIENGTIRTTEQFHRDILLMFQNAIMYNNSNHDVFKMATDMQKDAVVYIEEFISTQLLVQQPDSIKMLRSKDGGSRRTEATPAKQEDTERQRRGSSEAELSGKKRRTRADEY